MRARLKSLRRRWLLLVRGKCKWEGCTDPARGFPMYGALCHSHFEQRIQELGDKHRRKEFEREVQVQAEALRRTLPDALSRVGEEAGER